MPDPSLQKELRESVDEVLEKMFFIRALNEPGGENSGGEEIHVEIEFRGSRVGSVSVGITATVAHSIAADFLGAEENAIYPQQVEEVVCELANMICGSLLSRVDMAGEFTLGAPWVDRGAHLYADATRTVGIGDGLITASVRMERTPCSGNEEFVF